MKYPKSFAELYESRDDYKHFYAGLSPVALLQTINEDVKKFAKIVERFQIKELMQVLKAMSLKEAVCFAKGDQITSLALFDPEQFLLLDEGFFRAQYVFMVNKKFRFHKEFVKM